MNNDINHECYVCGDQINLEDDQFCYKEFKKETAFVEEHHWKQAPVIGGEETVRKYRHLWHGVPGITQAVGGAGGFVGYAMTLEDARRRAEQYLTGSSAPYAAPEVQQGEQAVLNEVERLTANIEKENRQCVICGQGHTQENALQLLPGGKQWTHKFCDGRGMSLFPFEKEI